jgi:hypothetical protein
VFEGFAEMQNRDGLFIIPSGKIFVSLNHTEVFDQFKLLVLKILPDLYTRGKGYEKGRDTYQGPDKIFTEQHSYP